MRCRIKVGDRVTTIHTRNLRWGTVTRITDLKRPNLNPPAGRRYMARVLWDGAKLEETLPANLLYKEGDNPAMLAYTGETLKDTRAQ